MVFDVEKIETPGWVIVRPGGDDEEAAREEMQIKARGIKAKRLRVSHHHEVSPTLLPNPGCVVDE